jgi:hypothetical protein
MRLSHLALLGALMATPAVAAAQTFSFVAMGDAPYQLPAGIGQFERLIERINTQQPAFSVHVGDIKSGGTRCDDAHFELIQGLFAKLRQPMVYTPGDNEWTDCHRPDNGGYDPLERLAKLRAMFFASPDRSHGQQAMKLESQGSDPKFAKFVENARWEKNGVHFASVHVVGSNNNLQRNPAAIGEYIERNAANIAWINSSFAQAMQSGAKAVVIAFQADPWFNLPDAREDQRSGFSDTIQALKTNVARFGKPVLIVHGDQHRLLIDKPLQVAGRTLHNATRLMVYGDRDVHGVLVSVDPADPDVFSFRSMTVTANLPAPPK